MRPSAAKACILIGIGLDACDWLMSILVDSNVLLRRAQPTHSSHTSAIQSVAKLLARGTPVYFTPQNIAEFWNVATRPSDKNGLGLSHHMVLAELATIEDLLTLLPDSPAIYPEWKRLVALHRVVGAKVHDARLAAVANVYGVRGILTFNTSDFVRYTQLEILHPSEL
jgi:predicted nucleic acid-binding protein